MSETQQPPAGVPNAEPTVAEHHSALFANLIMQQSNMAMLLMGRTKQPGADKPIKDLDAARLFIDQLEAIEAKTKGNLTRDESALLAQTLMGLRLEFVEAVGEGTKANPPESQAQKPPEAPAAPSTSEEESHKKFSKKY